MNVEDILHLLSSVVNVENQEHETYIELQCKSSSIEPIVCLTGSLSGSSNLSHKKPRNFKPYFIALNHGKFKALAITIRISKFIFQFPSLNFSNYFFFVTFSRKNNLSMGRS